MELRDGLVMNYSSLFIDVVWVRIYIFSLLSMTTLSAITSRVDKTRPMEYQSSIQSLCRTLQFSSFSHSYQKNT